MQAPTTDTGEFVEQALRLAVRLKAMPGGGWENVLPTKMFGDDGDEEDGGDQDDDREPAVIREPDED
jgi:hypothetical protein